MDLERPSSIKHKQRIQQTRLARRTFALPLIFSTSGGKVAGKKRKKKEKGKKGNRMSYKRELMIAPQYLDQIR